MRTRTKLAVFFASVCMMAASAALVAGCGGSSVLSLSDPGNISYDGTKITWDPVDNVSRYTVAINGGIEQSAGTATSLPFTQSEAFSVTVKAYGITDDINSSATQSFVPTTEVTDLTVDENCLVSWTGVNLVAAYNVKINDETNVVYNTEYQVTDAGSYTVYVSAKQDGTDENGAKYFPVWGSPITFEKLGTVSASTIGYEAFYGCTSLTSITIPDSVASIGELAFEYCTALTSVYYGGTETQWSSITINSSGNSYLTSATRYYYSEREPSLTDDGTAYDGNYWHYVDGIVTVWTRGN